MPSASPDGGLHEQGCRLHGARAPVQSRHAPIAWRLRHGSDDARSTSEHRRAAPGLISTPTRTVMADLKRPTSRNAGSSHDGMPVGAKSGCGCTHLDS
jgi:hypothetical protein